MDHILMIDDSEAFLIMTSDFLTRRGYKVIKADNGEKGLDLAENGNPDLILLDFHMPGMKGDEVIIRLKKNNKTKEIPIIMLTSNYSREDVVKIMKFGIADYILKPYNTSTFIKKIETTISINKLKKINDDADKSSMLKIIRDGGGLTIIELDTSKINYLLKQDIKNYLNPTFCNLTKNDTRILDIRKLSEVVTQDMGVIMDIAKRLNDKKLYIIAGRHYGFLIGYDNLFDSVELFISWGDLMDTIDASINLQTQ